MPWEGAQWSGWRRWGFSEGTVGGVWGAAAAAGAGVGARGPETISRGGGFEGMMMVSGGGYDRRGRGRRLEVGSGDGNDQEEGRV